jgi:hypothetical protein
MLDQLLGVVDLVADSFASRPDFTPRRYAAFTPGANAIRYQAVLKVRNTPGLSVALGSTYTGYDPEHGQ